MLLVALKCCLSVDVFWNVVMKINVTNALPCVFASSCFGIYLKFTYSSDTSPEGIADESNTSHR